MATYKISMTISTGRILRIGAQRRIRDFAMALLSRADHERLMLDQPQVGESSLATAAHKLRRSLRVKRVK